MTIDFAENGPIMDCDSRGVGGVLRNSESERFVERWALTAKDVVLNVSEDGNKKFWRISQRYNI